MVAMILVMGLDGEAGDSGLVLTPLLCSAVPWHWLVRGSYLPKSSQGTLPPSFGSEQPHGPSEASMAQAVGMAGQGSDQCQIRRQEQ